MRMIVITRQERRSAKISQRKALAMSNKDGHGKIKARSLNESIQRTTGAVLGGGVQAAQPNAYNHSATGWRHIFYLRVE
jgi:hypothetical protein